MSKKLYSTAKWKRRIKTAQLRESKKIARRTRSGSTQPSLRAPRRSIELRPPEVFSLLLNAGETADFLNKLAAKVPSYRVFIESANVTDTTPDAALALIATLKKSPNRMVHGSLPTSQRARSIFIQSGFLDHVRHGITVGQVKRGELVRYSSKEVDGELARRLILKGTESVFGSAQDSEAAYCVLLEGMQNTVDHAHYSTGHDQSRSEDAVKERWWALVYPDTERRRVCFALLDTGVGILQSARLKVLRKLSLVLGTETDADIIRDIFAGKLQSRTGLDNRGKGLPAIRALGDAGLIKNLTLVSNNVFARVCEDRYDLLGSPFSGTLLYWEIEK